MRPGTLFAAALDSAHWVNRHGMREHYSAATLHGIGDPHRTARQQTSSRPVGVAMNMPAIQQYAGHVNVNAPHAVSSSKQAGGSSKWKAFDR